MSGSRPQRVQVQCPVQFTHEDGVTGLGIMLNVSMGGCAIQSDTPVFDNMHRHDAVHAIGRQIAGHD